MSVLSSKKILFSLIVFLFLQGSGADFAEYELRNFSETSVNTNQTVYRAENYPGADISEKIRNAFAALIADTLQNDKKRTVSNVAVINGSKIVTAANSIFTDSDLGKAFFSLSEEISLPPGAFITEVISDKQVHLSHPVSASSKNAYASADIIPYRGGRVFVGSEGHSALTPYTTPIIVPPYTELEFGDGEFFCDVPYVDSAENSVNGLPVRLGCIGIGSYGRVKGQGIGRTILYESTQQYKGAPQLGVIGMGLNSRNTDPSPYTGIDYEIHVSDLEVRGRNNLKDAQSSAIGSGNLHGGSVKNVKIFKVNAFGMTFGGAVEPSDPRREKMYASGITVENCEFQGVHTQNLNVVNGSDITFNNNKFWEIGHPNGSGGIAVIDLEANTPSDRLINITVSNNVIDGRDSPQAKTNQYFLFGNGMNINAAGSVKTGGIKVIENVFRGGELPPEDKPKNTGRIDSQGKPVYTVTSMNFGILTLGVSDVQILRNQFYRTYGAALDIRDSQRFIIAENTIFNCGWSDSAISLANVTYSKIENNTLGKGDQAVDINYGLANVNISENGPLSDYNYIANNKGATVAKVGLRTQVILR